MHRLWSIRMWFVAVILAIAILLAGCARDTGTAELPATGSTRLGNRGYDGG